MDSVSQVDSSTLMDLFYQTLIPFTAERFKGKVDRGKTPYIEHCLAVADRLDSIDEKILGLLHDIVEDTDVTYQELEELGVPEDILEDLALLSKSPMEEAMTNAERVVQSVRATKVKIADIRENLRLERLPKVTPKDVERCNRYIAILHFFESRHPHLFKT